MSSETTTPRATVTEAPIPPMPGRIAALVFDMDGLMLDTEAINKVAWQTAAGDLGYLMPDAMYMGFVGRRTDDCERDLLAQFGGDFPRREFRPRWREVRRLRVERTGIPIKPGLLDLLRFAEAEGLALAVATSSGRTTAESTLVATDLLHRFSVLVTGDQIANGKPAPDIYLEAARRLGIEPRQCVALEDSDPGIIAASRAGMIALHIPDLKAPSDEATAAAFRVLGSLHEARTLLATLIRLARIGS